MCSRRSTLRHKQDTWKCYVTQEHGPTGNSEVVPIIMTFSKPYAETLFLRTTCILTSLVKLVNQFLQDAKRFPFISPILGFLIPLEHSATTKFTSSSRHSWPKHSVFYVFRVKTLVWYFKNGCS